MPTDDEHARLLAQEERDHQMAVNLAQQDQYQPPRSELPEYAPYPAMPVALPHYYDQQKQQYPNTPPYMQQQQAWQQPQQPAWQQPQQVIIIQGNPNPWIPIYTVNGTAQAMVAHHNLPPRRTAQYANAGYPGASTDAIRNPVQPSVTYRMEQVPVQEAIVANAWGNGVIHEERYDTNSVFRRGFYGRQGRSIFVNDNSESSRPKRKWF
ncbi:hypothetical protein HDU80_007822 [Chytriomyces hyalinus]|nr:hypothetical protein HDU80_007822 [Chytriomyces hyalinus]